jgi:hypothetical protein
MAAEYLEMIDELEDKNRTLFKHSKQIEIAKQIEITQLNTQIT